MLQTSDKRGVGGLDGDVQQSLHFLRALGQQEDQVRGVQDGL